MSPAQTAEEAARRMLDSKKLSNKINYDVLANLFNTDAIQQECVPEITLLIPCSLVQRCCTLWEAHQADGMPVSHMMHSLYI